MQQGHLPPTEADRLLLTPWSLAYLEAVVEMNFDPAVNRYLAGPWTDHEGYKAELARRIERPTFPTGFGYWRIGTKTESGVLRGYVVLMPRGRVGSEADIGWRLPASEWGKGFATEAWRKLMEYAFDALNLPSVWATVHPLHSSSKAVARRSEMIEVETATFFGRDMIRFCRTNDQTNSR